MPDRFGNLEIPTDRQADVAFVDTPLSLPRAPFAEHAVAAYVAGRVYLPAPTSETEPLDTSDRLIIYNSVHRLVAVVPSDVEAAWRTANAGPLSALHTQIRGLVPVPLLRDALALRTAADAVAARLPSEVPDRHRALPGRAAHTDDSDWLRVVGHARLLRLADKLYDLQTIYEYAQRFAKAVDADVMRLLQALPLDAPPDRHLDVIAKNLDKVHPKARSPLRNKLDTTRVVLGGVTLLPLFLGPARGLFDRYTDRLADQARRAVISQLGA